MVKLRIKTSKINENVEHLENRIDVNKIISELKALYAEEILAWYQYYIPLHFLCGPSRKSIEDMFSSHANDELDDHSDRLLKRIAELDGDIEDIKDFNKLTSIATTTYIAPWKGCNVFDLIRSNIDSEKEAIAHYQEVADMTKDRDYTTHNLMLEILADEEEHLRELKDFYKDISGLEFDMNTEYDKYDPNVVNYDMSSYDMPSAGYVSNSYF